MIRDNFQEVESNYSGRLSNFLRLIHPEIILIGIHSGASQKERGSVQQATGSGTLFIRDDKQSKDTIPMPTFARRPLTMSATILVGYPQEFYGWDRKDSKYRNRNSTNPLIQNLSWFGKYGSKIK